MSEYTSIVGNITHNASIINTVKSKPLIVVINAETKDRVVKRSLILILKIADCLIDLDLLCDLDHH